MCLVLKTEGEKKRQSGKGKDYLVTVVGIQCTSVNAVRC